MGNEATLGSFNSTEYNDVKPVEVHMNTSTGNVEEVEEYIEVTISEYFPSITSSVEVRVDEDRNSLFVVINYTITTTGVQDTIQLNLNNA